MLQKYIPYEEAKKFSYIELKKTFVLGSNKTQVLDIFHWNQCIFYSSSYR